MTQREISSTPPASRTRYGSGTWPWVLQRVSAVGLLLFLGIHMWFNHFARLNETDSITFEIVNMRFKTYPFLYALNDSLLLLTTIFHGFNGVRNVVYDLTTNRGLRQTINVLLIILGLVLFGLGAWALWALMGVTA
jgi:succinate dehydrogenase hydrophobic anchor subunit